MAHCVVEALIQRRIAAENKAMDAAREEAEKRDELAEVRQRREDAMRGR